VVDASQPCSIGAALAWLRKAFRADAAAGLHVVYQLELGGEGGGTLFIRVDDGRLELAEGSTPDPDVVFRIGAQDFFAVLDGRENPDLLFMADRLVVDGDLALALTLRKIFQTRV
jgi:putative sterol carrier protein